MKTSIHVRGNTCYCVDVDVDVDVCWIQLKIYDMNKIHYTDNSHLCLTSYLSNLFV